MKQWVTCVFLCLVVSLSAGQRARGTSESGRLGSIQTVQAESGLICNIAFEEPSGDGALSMGEVGKVFVSVTNESSDNLIQPTLEISIQSSWDPNPRTNKKELPDIKPGETKSYTSKIQWDKRLPSGIVTYKVIVHENLTGKITNPYEVSFRILGESTEKAEPVFVDVDEWIPTVPSANTNAVAVIIGNQNYSNADVPDVEYAINDAQSVKQYLIQMMGFQENNIIYVENASKADFERIFGTAEIHQGKLFNWVKPDVSDIFIYYSGHGAPDTQSKRAFFMPSNSDPNYVRIDGYSLDLFYQNLAKISAKSLTVVVDACFSGGSQEGMLMQKASPVFIEVQTPKVRLNANLLASASGDQIASWYPESNHSLFTYYFLRGLRGEADANRNRHITLKEMSSFLKNHVPYMARRLYGREQTPVVRGVGKTVLCKY